MGIRDPRAAPPAGPSFTNKAAPSPASAPRTHTGRSLYPRKLKNWIGFFSVIEGNTTGPDLLFASSYVVGIY